MRKLAVVAAGIAVLIAALSAVVIGVYDRMSRND